MAKRKEVERLWIRPRHKQKLLLLRAEDPQKFKTNYDVLDHLLETKKKRKGLDDFWQ